MKATRALLLAGAWANLFLVVVAANANECAKKPLDEAVANRIAAAAMNEYATFNGHRIDANGRLWKFGSTETENEPLLDPATGEADPDAARHPVWRRVWEYWLVLDQHVPGIALARKVIAVPGALTGDNEDAAVTEKTLNELFARLNRDPSAANDSLQQAALRAALSDSPWSAAFISFVMHQAGFDNQQFRYAAAHWQYVKQAFRMDQRNAYRACDPRDTQPRKGDLLCYSRGAMSPDDFNGWLNAASQPGFTAASHCEVVVMVDQVSRKMETIGGNVLQSVARRRLKLNGHGVLSAGHYAGSTGGRLSGACMQDKSCHQSNLNSQRWSVLLQLR